MQKYDQAIALFEKRLSGKQLPDLIPFYLGHKGITNLKTGKIKKSETFLNESYDRDRKSPIDSPSFFGAEVCVAMGENEKALQQLNKAYLDHEVKMHWMKVEPLFNRLHRDPQFENILSKIGIKYMVYQVYMNHSQIRKLLYPWYKLIYK